MATRATQFELINRAFKVHGWTTTRLPAGSFCARKVTNRLTRKVVEVRVIKSSDGYTINVPDYPYVNRSAMFAPKVPTERRTCCAINVNGSFIMAMRSCALWDQVLNRDYLVVNMHNKKSDKSYVKGRLASLTELSSEKTAKVAAAKKRIEKRRIEEAKKKASKKRSD